MARNDSFLNSGINSSTNDRRAAAKERRAEKRQDKTEARGKLMPAADIVFNVIDDEKRQVYDKLAKLPLPASIKEERVLARLEAIQMHMEFLEKFNTKMQNVLRMAPTPNKPPETEDADDE